MPIRFTEFIQLGDKEISLYIVQDHSHVIYKAFIYYGHLLVVADLERENDNWRISIEEFPHWVKDVLPAIIDLLEERFSFTLN
jgi:hypothetical protein